jgi:hypothetical protein
VRTGEADDDRPHHCFLDLLPSNAVLASVRTNEPPTDRDADSYQDPERNNGEASIDRNRRQLDVRNHGACYRMGASYPIDDRKIHLSGAS